MTAELKKADTLNGDAIAESPQSENLLQDSVKDSSNKKVKSKNKKSGSSESILPDGENTKFYMILAFILPMLLMVIGFANKKVFPFGDQQILVTDLWHQYYPFFRVLHEKLQSGDSLLYSWQSGMGTNFLALLAYYGASPLNLLSIAVPSTFLREALTVILILKIGCAGLFCSIFLKETFGKNDLSIVIFSLLFALCNYIMGYYWCVIWMDTVALLPLVVLGVEKVVKTGSFKLYTISLALCLITNYYIALFICIFTVISFFISNLYLRVGFKRFWKSLGEMILVTLLAVGLAAFINIPTLEALQLTHSVDNSFPQNTTWYENFTNIIANMNGFHEPTAVDGLPNIYTGALCIVMIGIFLTSYNIRIREKIGTIAVLTFIMISFNMNKLNYLWHGMHFTNQIPYRFAFLFSFVLVCMAYRAYTVIADGKINIIDLIVSIIIGGVFVWLSLSDDSEMSPRAVLWTAVFMGIYIVVIFLRERGWLKLELMNIILALVVVVEMSFNVKYGIEAVRTTSRSGYPAQGEQVEDELDKISSYDKEKGYRIELSSWYSLNDPSLYGYNGISQFSSMANESVSKWIRVMGLLGSEAGNRYFYASTSPLTNTFTNLKYMISKDGYNADTKNFDIASFDSNESQLVKTYENNKYVGLGFMVKNDLKKFDVDGTYTNPFEAQNEWFRLSSGIDEDLFTSIEVKDVGHYGLKVTKNGYGNYNVMQDPDAQMETGFYLKYNYLAPKNGMLFAYTDLSACKLDCITMEEGADLHTYNISKQPYIFPMGDFKKGTTVSLRMPLEKEENASSVSCSAKVYVYALNQKALQKAYKYYSSQKMTITKFTSTDISGTINSKEDGMLYVSVPYEKGWTVKVDGKETSAYKVGGAMTGLDLTKGEHKIEFTYSPAGFKLGSCISLISLVILIMLFIIQRKINKKKTCIMKYPALFTTDIPHNRKLKDQFKVESLEAGGMVDSEGANAQGMTLDMAETQEHATSENVEQTNPENTDQEFNENIEQTPKSEVNQIEESSKADKTDETDETVDTSSNDKIHENNIEVSDSEDAVVGTIDISEDNETDENEKS